MKKIEVTKYVADDGKEFDTEEACIKYENIVLSHRNLINCFDIFDSDLHRLAKPEYLWSSDPKELKEELEQDPAIKNFDFSVINEDAQYIVFRNVSSSQYQEIRDAFGFLSSITTMGDFVFPYESEVPEIIYYTGDEWEDFNCAVEEAKDTLKVYDFFKKHRGK